MIYQTLVVKDTRDVNRCWKWSVIITLLCVVATGLVVTFSFHALLGNFNTNCISGAKLVFKPSDIPSASASAASPAAGLLAATAAETASGAAGPNGTGSTEVPGAVAMATAVDGDQASGYADAEAADLLRRQRQRLNFSEQFRAHFEPIAPVSPQMGMSKLRRMTQPNGADEERMEATKRQQLAHNTEDFAFFDSQMIDEVNTYWGPMEPCEYISFVPLIEAIVAIVWVTMFMMCGNGGRSNENSFVDEPWRIVLPAFVFFALMTIVSAIHLLVLLARLAYFCSELKHKLHDQSVPCTLLINQFSINNDDAILPSHNYVLAITFSWLRLLFWALTVGVMTARCFKGTDFELVESPRAFSTSSMAGSGSGSGSRRTRAALLNGYTSGESGAEDAADGMAYGVAETRREKEKKRQQELERRTRCYLNNNEPKEAGEEDGDDGEGEEEEDGGGESDDTTLRVQDVVVVAAAERTERAPTATGRVVAAAPLPVSSSSSSSSASGSGGGGGSVHVNGVEFRPSAQLLQRTGYAPQMRPPATSLQCPAIAEESGAEQQPAEQQQQHRAVAATARRLPAIGGSNCRRLVNEIDQVRDANAAKQKRKSRRADSKA